MVKKSEGSFLGGFFNNPGTVAIALILGGLFIFRKQISEGLGGLFSPLGPIQEAGAQAGQFVFNIGQGAGESVFDAGKAFGDFVGSTQAEIDRQLKNFFDSQKADFDLFTQQFGQNIEDIPESAQKAAEEGGPLSQLFDFFNNLIPAQQRQITEQADQSLPSLDPALNVPDICIDVPLLGGGSFNTCTGIVTKGDLQTFVDEKPIPQPGFQTESPLLGGGPSFIGGTTTFGNNIVDTLTEVLNIFPQLTASQARDALEEFPGLTGNEFAQIDPDIKNIIGAGNINF